MSRFASGFMAACVGLLPFVIACAGSSTAESSGSGTGGQGGGSGDGGDPGGGVCVPGQQIECPCPGGSPGAQACNAKGTGYGQCVCGGTGGEGGSVLPDPCGDGVCDVDENCHTCERDCGTCEPCLLAPSCVNAQIPAENLPHEPLFDVTLKYMTRAQILERLQNHILAEGPGARLVAAALEPPTLGEPAIVSAIREAIEKKPQAAMALRHHLGNAGIQRMKNRDVSEFHAPKPVTQVGDPITYPGGTLECGAPKLRIRLAKITVHEPDDEVTSDDEIYCTLSSEAATGSEIRVSPITPELAENESYSFPISSGIFWGQQGPKTPGGNMLLSYNCVERDDSSTYQSILDQIATAAGAIGGSGAAGSNGWIFTVVGAVAGIVSDVLSLDGDDFLLNAQQTISVDQQLDLTNGRYWTVRKSGEHGGFGFEWDWELRVEAWGCAEFGTL